MSREVGDRIDSTPGKIENLNSAGIRHDCNLGC